MDNYTSQSPEADASRRRSGRVTRAPQKFTPEPQLGQTVVPKRKRGLGGDEDVDGEVPFDSEDDMSDDAADDEDDEHIPSRPKKSSKPARPRKPANKRVKTNGASVPGHSASLPSRPKKTVRIERGLPRDGTGLYADIFGSGDKVETVAEQWLTKYRESNATALAELVNCILQCSGCELQVTEDDIRDQENIPGRLADLQNMWQDEHITDYPLISRLKGTKSFRDLLTGFFISLVHLLHNTDVLYADRIVMENVTEWVASMSSATLRPFRHTATTVALAIQAGLVEVARILDHRITSVEQQVQAGKRGKNRTKVTEMQRALEEANQHREVCGSDIKEFFDTVFVHRYRDVDPRIRTECVEALGYWIWELPTVFMTPEYLRYLGWMLTDTAHTTRHEVLKQLGRMFKRDAPQLGHFIDRFRPRLVEIATKDLDASVRVSAISVIETLRENGMLEPDEIDSVGRLIFDSDVRVRKAVVSFFNACVQDLVESKIEDIGGSEVIQEVFGDAEEDDYDSPRVEWIHIKCMAENLAAYDRQIAEEAGQPKPPHGIDVDADILQVFTPETSMSLAAQVLYEKVPEVKAWESLAGYLLYDHTTSAKSRSKKARPNNEALVKDAVAPTDDEEKILLEILVAAAKLNLQPSHVDHLSKKKPTRVEGGDSPEETAVQLASVIPRLLNKFGATADTATLVLRLEHCLDLDVFQNLRQDSSKYEKLLDEISTQFNRHDDPAVLSEATAALLRARRCDELEELTDARLHALWENVVELLRNFDRYCEISTRGNLDVERLSELSVVLIKISKLASISDCIDVLETEGRSADSNGSVVGILVETVHRGKLETVDEDEIGDLENQVTANAIECCHFYFMWKIRSIGNTLTRGADVPVTVIDGLAYLKQKYWRHLIETFSTRALVDDLCRMATGSFCDFHVLLGGLRPIMESMSPEARKKSNIDRVARLAEEIEPRLVKELIYVFEGVEKQFAKLAKKILNEPAEDEDPIDDEDEDEDEEDENLSQEEKLAAQLRAEKNLCELAARLVLTISVKMVDREGPTAGRLRKRLLRNAGRLGNNYKDVVAFLDEATVAEFLLGKKKGGQKKPAPKPAAPAKSASKSAEVAIDDDDDENNDEEHEDEEVDEDPEPSEKEDEPVHNDADDDDILGD